jgi:hypothetical protein
MNFADKSPRMVGRLEALGYFIVGAVAGLLGAFVVSGVVGLTQPVWWGGEALVAPAIGLMGLLFVAVPIYIATIGSRTFQKSDRTRGRSLVTGAVWGALFPLLLALLGRLLQLVPGWSSVPVLAAVAIGVAVTAAMLVPIATTAIQLTLRKTGTSK